MPAFVTAASDASELKQGSQTRRYPHGSDVTGGRPGHGHSGRRGRCHRRSVDHLPAAEFPGSVLLVSHDMELMTVADTVHTLYFGEIIASGDMAAIQRDPKVREVYLGV